MRACGPPGPAGRRGSFIPPLSKEAFVLVLSRQRDEVITIGDDVEVTVVDIRGDKVRLGISAPPGAAGPPEGSVPGNPARAGRGPGSG